MWWVIVGTSNHPASTSWRSRWQSQGWPCGRACQTGTIYNVSCHAASAAINKGSPDFANKWVLHVSWDLLPVSTAWRRERSEELLPTPARNCEPASPKSGPAVVKKLSPPGLKTGISGVDQKRMRAKTAWPDITWTAIGCGP